MYVRRSALALLASGSLVTGLATSSPSYATGPAAGPGPTAARSSHPGPTAKPPRDSTPPKPVTQLRMARNAARSISLAWVNPTNQDFAGVLIRRAVGGTAPVTASDGTLVATLNSRQTSFTDKALAAASSYSYAVFSRDKTHNVGIAATLTTATRSTSSATGVRGKLTDQQGRGISAVQVEVREASTGNTVAGTATTGTGQFSVTGLTPGTYLLCFLPDDDTTGPSATGYLPGCYRQQPYGYGDTGTPVTVRAGKTTSGLVDYLPVAGAIAGRVTDSAGRGIADVLVYAYDSHNPSRPGHSASTRADGGYTVTGLAASSYQVCFYDLAAHGASSTGYLAECYDDQSVYRGDTTPVAVSLGRTSAGIDATLATAGAISGRVSDPAGAGVAGISASVSGSDFGYATSDSSGAYAITRLPSGTYTLCFDGTDVSSAVAPYGYTASCIGDQGVIVHVTAGQVSTANGTVEKAGALGGTVTGDSGPVPGVRVSVYDSSGRQVTSGLTDGSGNYQIPGLAPGEVTVCFDPTYTAGGYRRTCYGAQPDGSGSPITVTAGQLSTADVQLSRDGSITGTISDSSGNPISGVRVNAYGDTQSNGYYAQTDESGSYTIAGVTADDYRICFDPSFAQGPTGGYAAECYDNQPSIDTADLVTVGATGPVSVNAALSPGATITGRVTGSDGAVLGGATVYTYPVQGGQGSVAESDPDGSYRLSGLTAGDYYVCFVASPNPEPSGTGYLDECYDNQRIDSPGTLVHVAAGGVTAGIDAELSVGAAITGRVTDSTGNAIANVFVQISGVDGSELRPDATTDDLGRYRITGVPVTAVAVCFLPEDQGGDTGYQSECYDNKPNAGTATPVHTVSGQVSSGVDAVLDAGAAITGQVTDSAGDGIRSVSVYAYGVDGSYLGRADSTDETGHYRLVGLPTTPVAVCFDTYPEGGANGTGYLDECYDDQPDVSTADPVTTPAGQVSSGVDAELADAPPA